MSDTPDILVPLSDLGKPGAGWPAPPAPPVPFGPDAKPAHGEGRQIEEPAGLADFLASRIPSGSRSETILFRKNKAGEEETLWTYRDEWPTEHDVGSMFGGGRYRVVVTLLGTGSKKAPKYEWSFVLPSYPWDRLAADRRRREEQEDTSRVLSGLPAGGSQDLKSRLEELRMMQAVIQPQSAQAPAPSFLNTDGGKLLAGAVVAMLPKLLDRFLSPPASAQPQKTPTEIFQDQLAMTSSLLSLHKDAREVMQDKPEAEEGGPSWLAAAVGLLDALAPTISALMTAPKIARAPMVHIAKNAPEVQAAQTGTPIERQTLADAAVKNYGITGARQLFEELGIPSDGIEFREVEKAA